MLPPPSSLVADQIPVIGPELYWKSKPGFATIPYCLNLPLNIGPPPYVSKHASIRYLLRPSLVIKVGNKRVVISQSRDIQMFTVHDPEKALASLPSPLLATDTASLPPNPASCFVKLTAGIHRQTWINGTSLFTDVHITNNTAKPLKRISLQLEKRTLYFAHPAVGTLDKSAAHLRLPKRQETEIISTTNLKKSKQWKGVSVSGSEIRTCDIFIPRGHVTIRTGRYFEVRFFVNILVPISMFKSLAVQLPITIIHMNSLDILPNALAQVALSVDAKRARHATCKSESVVHTPYHQGQAFVAPRCGSLSRIQKKESQIDGADIKALMQELDNSPRRNERVTTTKAMQFASFSQDDENTAPKRLSITNAFHGHHTRHPSCYHCHILDDSNDKKPEENGPKLPRLQMSTSGLGFSESEFEISADSPPRKVMLSELERQLISQQRELQVRRQHSQSFEHRRHLITQPKSLSLELRRHHNITAGPDGSPRRSKTINVTNTGRRTSGRTKMMRDMSSHSIYPGPVRQSVRHHRPQVSYHRSKSSLSGDRVEKSQPSRIDKSYYGKS